MQRDLEITLLPEQAGEDEAIKAALIKELRVDKASLKGFKILKRSIDARSRRVVYRMQVRAFIDEHPVPETFTVNYPNVAYARPVIVVGAGPAGLFAALRCIEQGLKPIVIERGKDVKQRRRDLAAINRSGIVNPESNYCFGEGGAGTYSDGKLYTRSNKRGDVNKVLEVFVQHGAPADILVDARPHIGTNKLPGIITGIRETILNAGGEIRFGHKVTDLLIEAEKVKGVVVNIDGDLGSAETHLVADAVILATGHSARDIYELLNRRGILIEPKPFALGVRIEHPQEVIDAVQYHCDIRSEYLPPAYYSLVEQVGGKGVFSFCMCPGGIIAPCATAEGEVVVNGWSPSKRNNPYANSGTVVQIGLEDVAGDDPMKMLRFQTEIEKAAFAAGGGKLVAPAQRMIDFVEGRLSADLPGNSYLPGTKSVMLAEILPDFVASSLKQALPLFGRKMKGYYTNEAVLVGVESRTSSPVRIPRDKETLQHPFLKGLFPCAEGAGYAGGIVSAAIDGINCADAVKKAFEPKGRFPWKLFKPFCFLYCFDREGLQIYWPERMNKKTLIIGATPNADRYAYLAAQMLTSKGHDIVNVGIKKGIVAGVEIEPPAKIHDDIDTVTLYIGPQVQKDYYDYILKTGPKRVVFNPGTENLELESMVRESGAEAVRACTLVMLSTGQY